MRASCRPVRLAALAAILLGLLTAAVLARPPAAAAVTAENAAGRYDTLVLRDLGGHTAALVQLVAEEGAFTPVELWRSKKGAFDVSKAVFVAGDVNGDGIGDGIVLYDLGKARSRLLVYLSDGTRARQTTAWTSRPGAFAKARARLAVGDVNRDGLDDVIALYDRGLGSAALFRFTSTGAKFRRTTAWSARRGYSCTGAQLAAGDATGDGRDDAIVLYRSTAASSRLDVFVAGATKFTEKAFWRGEYAVSRARLAAGDVDSDGDCDVVCLYRTSGNVGRLDAFLSTKKVFAAPAVWCEHGAAGGLPFLSTRLAVGDLTGDGRADAVVARPVDSPTTSLTTFASNGSGFVPSVWWQGAWAFGRVRPGVAPSPGMVLSDEAEVLDGASTRYLRRVEADGTLTFAGETGQLSRLAAGDVLLAGAEGAFPNGLCRKVSAVSEVDGRVVVETAPATLSDVIDEGEVAFSKQVTFADLEGGGTYAPGVALARAPAPPGAPPAPGAFGADGFGFDLETTIAGTLGVKGSVWLDPSAYVDWEIGLTGLESASYTQTMTTTTDLEVSVSHTYTGEKEATLFKRTLAPITIMAGPVPVVVTPEFEVYVGARGELEAGVTAGMTLESDASVSIAYDDDDGWSHSSSCSHAFTPHPPQLFTTMTMRGYAGAGLAFKLYTVAGPTAKLEAYTELEAKVAEDPWWTLNAGLDGIIGFELEALDITILEEEFTIPLVGPVEIDRAGSPSSGGGSSGYQAPSIRGKIFDSSGGVPLQAATVEVSDGGSTLGTASSAADGSYVFRGLSPGAYTVTAAKDRYADDSRSVTVASGQTTEGQDITLTRSEFQGVRGHVYGDPGGYPLFNARVRLTAVDDQYYSRSDWTPADGSFEFQDVAPGDYVLSAELSPYFSESRQITVAAGQMLEDKDLHLVQNDVQGVSGRIVAELSGDPVAGALVTAFEGGGEAGYFEGSAVTAADGSFAIPGLEAGTHGLIVTQPGYVDDRRDFQVMRAAITDLGDIVVGEIGGQSMRSEAGACIRWAEGVSAQNATVEFWYRPLTLYGTEYGTTVAEITRDYPDWMGDGLHRFPTMVITYREVPSGVPGEYITTFAFILTEDKDSGDPNEPGTYHTLSGGTPIETGHWYHIAAEYGTAGMKLFVNGHLEASNGYTGAPEAFAGAAEGGWFSLGEYYLEGRPNTASGDYRGLCVGESQRYDEDFTPPDSPIGGWDALILDDLTGVTNGENRGFVPTP